MIKLTNVGKCYNTRRKRKIYGLKDVNLSFPDKGLCLILGQSGGGKTTLLNILGGLDVKYEGEYEFMGKKLEQKDFAELRQSHISFVFQDFNLIDDYNVYENVALGTQLSQDADGDVSTALQRVGLQGYESRYPKELSGGQQQRVAIARALLKQSSVLLADEPTGNLDSQNSIEIYNLLKEISRDKLVIVVSHDEERGLQYADYVVRLNKGKVAESNLPEVALEHQYVSSKQHLITHKQAFKMGAKELSVKRVKSALTITLMAICFCVLSFTILAVALFRMSDVHYELIKDMDYPYVMLTNVTYGEYCDLKSSGVDMIAGFQDAWGAHCILMDKEQAESRGFEFYDGALPLEADCYYVSDYALEQLCTPDTFGRYHNEAIIDGKLTRFKLGDIPHMTGQRIMQYGRDRICAGVFKSSINWFDDEFEQYKHALDKSLIVLSVNYRGESTISMDTLTDATSFDVWVKTNTVVNLRGLLATHNNRFDRCDIYSPVSAYESDIGDAMEAPQLALLITSLVLVIATILLTNLLISGQIVGQKRKIGIYKALGATNGDIMKIYLYEMLVIALPMIILAIASTAIVTVILNNVYIQALVPELTVLTYRWVNVPITIVAVLAVLFVGVIAPLRKITKLNIIEAIKGTVNK